MSMITKHISLSEAHEVKQRVTLVRAPFELYKFVVDRHRYFCWLQRSLLALFCWLQRSLLALFCWLHRSLLALFCWLQRSLLLVTVIPCGGLEE